MSVELFIAPISGPRIWNQYYQMMLVADAISHYNYSTSNVTYMGASGGSLALTLSYALNWNRKDMEKILDSIDTSLLFEPWVSNCLTRTISLAISGSYTKTSSRFEPFLLNIFSAINRRNDRKFLKNEFVILTYKLPTEKEDADAEIFSNQSESTSKFIGVTYINGDIKTFAKLNQATSSLPFITSSVKINGRLYKDGGLDSPSPYTRLASQLTNVKKIIYFTHEYTTSQSGIGLYFDALINSNQERERKQVTEIVKNPGHIHMTISTTEDMISAFRYYVEYETCVMMFVSPYNGHTYDILNMKPKDISNYINKNKVFTADIYYS